MKPLRPIITAGKSLRVDDSGQIMAEAAIGMALIILVWILTAFSSYMANNRIRTLMAARYVAWMQGNGANPSDSTVQAFFYANDAPLAHLQPAPAQTPVTVIPVQGFSTWAGLLPKDFSTWSTTVTFGVPSDQLSGTTQFPFVLLNAELPIIRSSPSTAAVMGNFTTVSSQCGWSTDATNSWNSLSGLLSALGLGLP